MLHQTLPQLGTYVQSFLLTLPGRHRQFNKVSVDDADEFVIHCNIWYARGDSACPISCRLAAHLPFAASCQLSLQSVQKLSLRSARASFLESVDQV